jgi:phage major tail protein, phi13 family
LIGTRVYSNRVLVSASEDGGAPVAIGFRAARSSGKYQYFWLYRVKFTVPKMSLSTKADKIEFATPEIEGTISRRNKPDTAGKHPGRPKSPRAAPASRPR